MFQLVEALQQSRNSNLRSQQDYLHRFIQPLWPLFRIKVKLVCLPLWVSVEPQMEKKYSPQVGRRSSKGLSHIMSWNESIVVADISRLVFGWWKPFANHSISALKAWGICLQRIALEGFISIRSTVKKSGSFKGIEPLCFIQEFQFPAIWL